MSDDNIIKLHDIADIHIPEIQNRSGSVRLVYGGDVDEDSGSDRRFDNAIRGLFLAKGFREVDHGKT